MGDDEQGHEGQGHEGGGEGAAEAFGEEVDGGVGFGDLVAVAGAHEAGDGEGEDEFGASGGGGGGCGGARGCGVGGTRVDATEAALVSDDEIDGAAEAVVVDADGDDVVTVMGNRRRDGAAREAEVADKGLGDGCVGLVAVDDDYF